MITRETSKNVFNNEYFYRNEQYLLRNIGGIDFLVPTFWHPTNKPILLRINDTGKEIWHSIKKETSLGSLTNKISKKYSTIPEKIRLDIIAFLDELKTVEAIKFVNNNLYSPDIIPSSKHTRNSKDFFRTLVKNHFRKIYLPLSMTWEMTHRCNLNCVHCYVSNSKQSSRNGELDFRKIKNIIRQLEAAGCLQIILTGGELFTRSDILEIITEIKRAGIFYSIYTNGTLINSEIIDALNKYPPLLIEVSMYGFSKQCYETVTRADGSYQKFRKGLDLLIEKKFDLRLKSVAIRHNYREIESMKKFADELGTAFRFDALITSPISHTGYYNSLEKIRLKPNELLSLELKNLNKFKRHPTTTKTTNYYPDTCGAGRYEANIDPYGKLSLCLLDRYPFYNLQNGNVKQGWDIISKIRQTNDMEYSDCSVCEARVYCHICPGWSKVENQTNNTKVQFLCDIAKTRLNYFKKPPGEEVRK